MTRGCLFALDTSARYIDIAFTDTNFTDITHADTKSIRRETRFLGNQSTRRIPALLETLYPLLPAQLDGIVYGSGPGSFTGVRIALAIASALALARNIKLTPVSSFLAYAEHAYACYGQKRSKQQARVLIDAGRSGYYYATIVTQEERVVEQTAAFYRQLDERDKSDTQNNWIACGPGWRTVPEDNEIWQGCVWCALDRHPNAVAMIECIQKNKSTHKPVQWYDLETLPPLNYFQPSVNSVP